MWSTILKLESWICIRLTYSGGWPSQKFQETPFSWKEYETEIEIGRKLKSKKLNKPNQTKNEYIDTENREVVTREEEGWEESKEVNCMLMDRS